VTSIGRDSRLREQIIVPGHARRSERANNKSNLRSAIRFATVMIVASAGLIIASLCGIFYFG
jgi:hypothetical protein